MSDLILPARPSLEQLKKQAKELLESITRKDASATALLRRHHPAGQKENQTFALHDAQLVLARQYGFISWPKLKEAVERRTADLPARIRRFVLDALNDNPRSLRRAWQVEPELARANLWTRLATADLAGIREALNKDHEWVTVRGGPRETWLPLHYVCFSRLQMENAESRHRFTEGARLLLDAGADPNASWEDSRWLGCPLSPLYGATGVNNNPELTRLLLERGAEVNDGESIYHSAQYHHVECMEVLREFGVSLGKHPRWENTPLYFLLEAISPDSGDWPKTRLGVRWLLDHGCDPTIPCGSNGETALHTAIKTGHNDETIGWLLESGADVNQADQRGVLAIALAHRLGRKNLVVMLKERGAQEVELTPNEQFFECAFSGDREGLQRVLRGHPALVESFTEDDRLALNRASERGNVEAAKLLLEAGFDIAFKGTKDWGSTPLHIAAWHGWADMVEMLLAHGAPLDVKANKPEESLPLGWAAHGSSHCRNPQGDYPRLARAMLAAGGIPWPSITDMSSPEVAEIFHSALAG
jgi:ankyrin repeat protein